MKKVHKTLGLVIAALMLFTTAVMAGTIQYTLDKQGLPEVSYNGKKLFEAAMPFWGANWRYAWMPIKQDVNDSSHWTGECSENLFFTTDMKWNTKQKNKMVGTYEFDVSKTVDPAIGGGFQFQLPLEELKKNMGASDPVLLGNKGWEWQLGDGKFVKITFEPELAKVYFEMGNKGIIRCMVFVDSVSEGKKSFKMIVEIPQGSVRVPSTAERYGKTDRSIWIKNALNPTKSFIDLSYLNHKPAGKHGFIKTSGDKFVMGNGKPIKFWGCNVQAYSLFMADRALIKAHAKRIAALGFNLVRLHHMDSQRWVEKCLIKMGDTSQELDLEALDTYFYWIKCLKDEGIYLWVDLHVGRTFRKGDNIPGFNELIKKVENKRDIATGTEAKGYCYINDRIKELMQQFNKKLLTTVNPYTKTALKDETAIMGFQLTNENDLTHHFGNALLADNRVPFHNKIFKEKAGKFAAQTGLNAGEIQTTWLPGVSKIFLNDLEYKWNMDMIKHLHKLGVKQPIDTCHMWGVNPLYSVPALTAGDMIDVHVYSNGEFLTKNPRGAANAADYVARSQIAGMPLTITEWNSEEGSNPKDKFVLPVLIGAMGAFQGWDAPMLYGYSQDTLTGERVGEWSSHNVPNIIGTMPAVALMYRQQHVSEAKQTFVAKLTRKTLFMEGQYSVEPAFSTLSLMHKVLIALPKTKELPWLKATKIHASATTFTDLQKDFIPAGRTYVESDTGELRRDWEKGLFTINTPKTQAAVGWLKKAGPISLNDVSFKIDSPKAAVIVTSLDNKPIARSQKMLITALGRIHKQNVNWWQEAVSEPIAGKFKLRNSGNKMTLVPLNGDGTEQAGIVQTKSKSGFFTVTLPTDKKTHWFLLKVK